MNKSLLDTDILSEINKGRDQQVLTQASQYLNAYPCFTLSVVTVMEVVRGYYLAKNSQRLSQFLAVLDTGNTSHYNRIQALGYPLVIENWRVSPPQAAP